MKKDMEDFDHIREKIIGADLRAGKVESDYIPRSSRQTAAIHRSRVVAGNKRAEEMEPHLARLRELFPDAKFDLYWSTAKGRSVTVRIESFSEPVHGEPDQDSSAFVPVVARLRRMAAAAKATTFEELAAVVGVELAALVFELHRAGTWEKRRGTFLEKAGRRRIVQLGSYEPKDMQRIIDFIRG